MRPSLRLVIGALCAVIVLVVAVITLTITYTVSLATVRDIGKKHALALATTARVQSEAFFEKPTADLDALANIFKHEGLDLPSALPDQTDLMAKEVINKAIYVTQRTSNYTYTAIGVIFEDASGASAYPSDTGKLNVICRFRHNWPAGNMSTIYREYNLTDGFELPRSDNFTNNIDARFSAYATARQLAGANRQGMWYPVTVYVLGGFVNFMYPAAKPMYNRTNGFIGFSTVGQPLQIISEFLRAVRGTPNTEAFAVQSDLLLVGSSHPSAFFTISQHAASATVPTGCASSSATSYDASSPVYHGCRLSAASFPYAPLQKAAEDRSFLTTSGSEVRSLDAGEKYFVVSTAVRNRYRFWGLNIVLCMPESDILGDIVAGRNTAIGVTVAVFIFAAFLAFGLVYALLQPLSDVSRRMLDTARLKETEDTRQYSSLAEIRDLQMAYTDMNTAIKSFTRYVPRDVVKDLMASGQLCEIKMAPLQCTMLFVDIAGFTTVCERVPPDALSSLVSQYFDRASRIVMEYEGLIDKFIGDCIMAVWGAPFGVSNQEVKATLAGKLLDRETMVAPLSTAWDEAGELLRVRVGISTGEVLAGNMGSADRMNYTVIGDPVNLAARLESLNKQFDTRVMVSEMTAEGLGGVFVLRLLMPIAVVGKEKPVKAYEVMGLARELRPSDVQCMDDAEFRQGSGVDSASDFSGSANSDQMGRSMQISFNGNASGGAESVMSASGLSSRHVRRSKKTTAQMVRDAAKQTATAPFPLTVSADDATFAAQHTKAVFMYTKGQLAQAISALDALEKLPAMDTSVDTVRSFRPERSVAVVRELCEKYLREGMPEGFNGTFKALEK